MRGWRGADFRDALVEVNIAYHVAPAWYNDMRAAEFIDYFECLVRRTKQQSAEYAATLRKQQQKQRSHTGKRR